MTDTPKKKITLNPGAKPTGRGDRAPVRGINTPKKRPTLAEAQADRERRERREANDRPPRREGGSFGDRPPRRDFGDRPPRRDGGGFGDRPPRRDGGSFGDRPPRRDFGDRPPRQDGGGFGDRPPRRDGGSFGDRPPRRDFGDRPPRQDGGGFGDRPPRRDGGSFGDRPPRRDFGDRPPRQDGGGFGDRPPRRDGAPFGDRPPRRDFGDRPPRQDGGNFGDRPPRRDGGSFGDRPPRRDFGDRPPRQDGGSFGDRPPRRDGDSFGDRPPRRDGGSFGDRPPRRDGGSFSDRPHRPEGDRPQRHGGFEQRAPRPERVAPARVNTNEDGERLSKVMADRGLASRREADEWIGAGYVQVNGAVAVLGQRVPADAQIDIDPRAKELQAQRVTILLHKPIGVVSGQPEDGYEPAVSLVTAANRWADDPTAKGLGFNPNHLRGLAPAGRLDIDSTGLLVFTQDGRVAKHLIGDDSDVEKEYLVRVALPGAPDDLALLNHGLELDGVQLREAKVSWANEDQLRFVLREGRKRQIRRMCEAVGLQVLALKRVRIGRVPLSNLPMGQWRYLAPWERF
jgi:23S rRNA pseudouridine2604 synthase